MTGTRELDYEFDVICPKQKESPSVHLPDSSTINRHCISTHLNQQPKHGMSRDMATFQSGLSLLII